MSKTYDRLKSAIVECAEKKFNVTFDHRSKIKLCSCLSGPCVMHFEDKVMAWCKKRAGAEKKCAGKGHDFKTVTKCRRCGVERV